MFEWGFWEFVVIGVIALVVIGPERLPRVARVAGLWIGRARRTLGSVQEEIRRELKADELKEIMDKHARSRPLETILEESPKKAVPTTGASDATSGAGAGLGQTPRSPDTIAAGRDAGDRGTPAG
jgi:sec-independent protein translocase protein TatB